MSSWFELAFNHFGIVIFAADQRVMKELPTGNFQLSGTRE